MASTIRFLITVCFFVSIANAQHLLHQNEEASSIDLISSHNGTTELQFNLGKLFLKSTAGWGVQLYLDNGVPILKKGAPDLPKLTSSIIIPDMANMQVEILEEDFTEILGIDVAPSKGTLSRAVKPSAVPFEYGQVYQVDEFFPTVGASLQDPYILRDYRGQTVIFYPVRYNPVSKVLRIYNKIRVRVSVKDGNGINQLVRSGQGSETDKEFGRIYSEHFLNYNQESRYSPVEEGGSMLIIAHPTFENAMQSFVDWKIQRGLKTTIVTTAITGTTSAQIKTYVQNYYATHPELKYLLLVGDAAQIPPQNPAGSNGLAGPSDSFYGYLAGNDAYPEVFVGRFSSETVAHVQTQVERSVAYEKTPQPGDWYSRGTGIASNEGPGDDGEMDYEHVRNLRSLMLGYTYSNVDELYDGSQGGMDAPGNPGAATVSSVLGTGRGVVNYTGHGSNFSWATSGFNSNDVAILNNPNKLPFVWSVGCVNGEFMNLTCFAEYWLRSVNASNQPIGAVATFMSTINQYWNQPMEAQDEMVNILTESAGANIKRTFGGISFNGCMSMNDAYGSSGDDMTDTWVIFGDPSLMIRTAEPQPMIVSHSDSTPLGSTSLAVNCNTNDAFVSLTMNGQILGTDVVVNGWANISFAPVSSIDTILVTVTAFNRTPYQGIVEVIPVSGPFVSLSAFLLNDVSGNNNALADYAEQITMDVNLANLGLSTASGVEATLSTTSAHVIIIDNFEAWGSINDGSNSIIPDAFAFNCANDVADQTMVTFILTITDDNSNVWVYPLNVILQAPVLHTNNYVASSDNGNNNGSPDPGETVSLTFVTGNTGHSDSPPATCSLDSDNPNVVVLNSPQNLPSIIAGQDISPTFDIQVSASASLGETVILTYHVNAGAYTNQVSLPFVIGQPRENFESGDFLQYAWQFSGNEPWTISDEMPFEGDFCSRSGVIADNQTSSMQITFNSSTNDSISFYKRVSSESGWDYLHFRIDNVLLGQWSGEVPWSRTVYPVGPGSHTARWTYFKDIMLSEGEDAAWVDFIIFPVSSISSGMEEESQVNFGIYPNPATDALMLEFSVGSAQTISINATDLSGRLIWESAQTKYPEGDFQQVIPVHGWKAGMYTITLRIGDKAYTKKVLINLTH